jgi:hypothetical protein
LSKAFKGYQKCNGEGARGRGPNGLGMGTEGIVTSKQTNTYLNITQR